MKKNEGTYTLTIASKGKKKGVIPDLPHDVVQVMLSAALSYLLGSKTMKLRD